MSYHHYLNHSIIIKFFLIFTITLYSKYSSLKHHTFSSNIQPLSPDISFNFQNTIF